MTMTISPLQSILDVNDYKECFRKVNRFSMESINLRRHTVFMISAAQCRAARGLLDWSQQELATQAGVGIVTVRQLESGASEPRRSTLEVVKQAFERAGVEFIEENGGGFGVRLCKSQRGRSSK
jgi:ribosome-binding protein aMBF1 (putative translation factor)